MKYRVLGPLEVDADAGPLPLAGKQEALMALLLLHANETLSTARIAEELDCDAVEDVVKRLRAALPEDVVETRIGRLSPAGAGRRARSAALRDARARSRPRASPSRPRGCSVKRSRSGAARRWPD